MSGGDPVPWTVVNRSADGSPETAGAIALLDWLAEHPDVRLHSVLWLPGWADTDAFRRGTFHDVARDHARAVPRVLRRLGRDDLAGKVTARAIRSTLARAPRDGVVYLNGPACAPALRYLPAGRRSVLTRLRADDEATVDGLPEAWIDQLVTTTDVWLAADDASRDWAMARWSLDPAMLEIVPEPVDLVGWDERHRPDDPDHMVLALAGGTWFRSDHTGRLVQTLLRMRPSLKLGLVWAEVERESTIAPLLHDLEVLGVRDRVHLPSSHPEVAERLRDAHVLAMTTPDDEPSWLAWDAAQKGLPVVCFDSHQRAAMVDGAVEGRVVEYLDVAGMAEAVLTICDEARTGTARDIEVARAERARRDIRVIGPRLADLAVRAGQR